MKNLAIGVDIGGSHISSVLVEMESGKLVTNSYFTCQVNNKASATEILKTWVTVLQKTMQCASFENIAGIGFAMPGPFDYEKGIALFEKVEKFENLFGKIISEEIISILQIDSNIAIRYINDATSFAIGESWQGRAVGFKRSVSLTLGTGLGSAFIDNGLPVVEREDIPSMGCFWHLPFKNGIADDYFSTRWFVDNYYKRTGKQVSGVKEIAKEASSNDTAKELFFEFGDQLGCFIGEHLSKFQTEILIIGGNITKAYNLFGKSLEAGLKKQHMSIPIEISQNLEASALLGSARLLDDEFWFKVKPLLNKM